MSAADALAAPVWIAVNLVLATAMWRAARRLCPGDLFFDRLRHTIVLCWATVVGVGIVLGASGLVSAPALLAMVAGVAATVCWFCGGRADAGLRKTVGSTGSNQAGFVAGGRGGCRAAGTGKPTSPGKIGSAGASPSQLFAQQRRAPTAAQGGCLSSVQAEGPQEVPADLPAEQPAGLAWLEGYAPVERWCWRRWSV